MYCNVIVVCIHVLYCDSGKSVHVFIVTVLCVHVLYCESVTYTCIVL